MTTEYFDRHAEPDNTNHNDMQRPLAIKGKEDSKLVTNLDRTKIRKAVGAIIVTSENKFLLVHKAEVSDGKDSIIKTDSRDFIKGGVKENEAMLDALKREIFEETGIEHFIIKKEFDEKICFEFPHYIRDIIGYDKQETTMYLVQIDGEPQSELKCIDGEIDQYEFVEIDSVSVRLSQEETLKFWTNINMQQGIIGD